MHEVVTLRLSRQLLRDAQAVASARGITVGEMIRRYLALEAQPHVGLVARQESPAFAELISVFDGALNWSDLIAALKGRGYYMRAHGTGLALYATNGNRHLCNTATLGYRYRKLVKRFGAPMPGHPHGQKWLKQEGRIAKAANAVAQPGPN